jgi:quercetin dioxygenase-like cupin family protein
MGFGAVEPGEFGWITRPHGAGEPARQVAELSDLVGLERSRANVWRYEPGAAGKRHRHRLQEETFVVLAGTLTMYLGEPPEAVTVPTGGVIHVEAGTALQTVNRGDEDLLVYVHGSPPEDEGAEVLESAV